MAGVCSEVPAGVSLLQGKNLQDSNNPVDTKFLASSHFTVSQDPHVTSGALKSVFKKDYIPWMIDDKPAASRPPRPADVLQTDARYFNERASETKNAYEYRFLEKPVLRDVSEQLRATNFKMDKDKHFDSFKTTHNIDYTPKEGMRLRGQPTGNPMKSYIPQGDKEKAPEPMSDYRDRYRGHDALTTKPDKASGIQPGPSTIQGDSRQHHFSTTHDDTFKGTSLPKVDSVKKVYLTNIPQGDPSQVHDMHTVQQMSFPAHKMDVMTGYDKSDTTGKLQGTNFKQQDGQGTWDTYLSTMAESYVPLVGDVDTSSRNRDRNHSDLPEGDNNKYRNTDRAMMTTNKFHYGNAPHTTRPVIVSGANKRTSSNVCFGLPELADQFYETTTDSTFKPSSVPYNYKRSQNNTLSTVPLDYYGNENNGTTYQDNFENPRQGRMTIHECALDSLKGSHMKAPLGGHMQFSTEHLDQYTPKDSRKAAIDPGKLQRSSVPLGTLSG